ncbi:patatin-like phospholipase family protein [Parvularcula sp. ZS-1/3]|uniref:Patatin-like phospholipase family protein n=1 Tax=Parvularcula mediterranea TaxID=2732508 RepID=A0A7Y3RQ05_9PROT|nr:patatin-like phospholipase family protein [Parvularcula mediterranea]NNU17606.1 patatin-like phospholipase family protein [Parvularcula mediterranea]
MAEKRKSLNLALQGGGAHGAFAWGVCDKLLESKKIKLNAITATSAGAMIATVLAYGMHLGDDEGAREKLDEFWEGVSRLKNPFELPMTSPLPFFQELQTAWTAQAMGAVTSAFSPYQLNPLNWNPLRELVDDIVDFDRLRECNKIKLFVSATNVRTGKVKVFRREEISIDACMASACLPHLFQAVEIDGEAYWDGGYIGNPSLWPLFYETEVEDLLLVHINPMVRNDVPTTVPEIENRLNEVTFNASLLKEMRAINFVQKLLREGWIKDEYRDQLSDIKYHAIRADTFLDDFALPTKYQTDLTFLRELKAIGREAASSWIDSHWDQLGRESSCDLQAEFLGNS